MIRTLRLLQSWPLLHLGAAIVGLIICTMGWVTGRQTWIRFGMWFTVPFFGLIVWLVTILMISATLNMGILSWRWMKRVILLERRKP